MSLFELQRNYHILTYILSLFTSPPIFLSASHVLSPARVISAVRASVHYNVKNTRRGTGGRRGEGRLFIYNESKIAHAGGGSNTSPIELTEVISNTPGWIYIFRCNHERGEKFDGGRGDEGGGAGRRKAPIINLLMRGEHYI